MTSTPNRLAHLDALRGLAAILVVMEHARAGIMQPFGSLEEPSLLLALFYGSTSFGHEAVMIFFALSGYLVGGQSIARIRANNFDAVLYGLRRLTRLWIVIFPALILTLIWDVVGLTFGNVDGYNGGLSMEVPSLAKDDGVDHSPWSFFGNVLFLQTITVPTFGSNGPMWSLAYEFWYYILGPLLFLPLIGGIKPIARVVLLVVLIALLISLPSIIAILGLIWLAGALMKPVSDTQFGKKILSSWICIVALLVPALVAFGLQFLQVLYVPDLLLGSAAALAIPALVQIPSPGCWYNRISEWIAETSYSLYLVHFPMIVALCSILILPDRLPPDSIAFFYFIVMVTLSIIYGWLVYVLAESHTNRVYKLVSQTVK